MTDFNRTGCENDWDCVVPGAVCYKVSWFELEGSNSTGFCECDSFYGWTGSSCNGLSSGTSLFLFVTLSLEIVVAGLVAGLGAKYLIKALRVFHFRVKQIPKAAFISMLACTLGLLFYVLYRVCKMLNLSFPNKTSRLNDDLDAEKLPMMEIEIRVVVFLMLICAIISVLQVSVLWVELGYRATHLRRGNNSRGGVTSQYLKFVRVMEISFIICMGIIAALGLWHLAMVVAFPFMMIIQAVIIVGRRRMVTILREAMNMQQKRPTGTTRGTITATTVSAPQNVDIKDESSKDETSNDLEGVTIASSKDSTHDSSITASKSSSFLLTRRMTGISKKSGLVTKDAMERTRRTILAIERASLHILIGGWTIIIIGVPYFLLDGQILHPQGHREYCEFGKICYVTIFESGVIWGILYVFLAVFHYTRRAMKKIIKRQEGISSSLDPPRDIQGMETVQDEEDEDGFHTPFPPTRDSNGFDETSVLESTTGVGFVFTAPEK